MLIEVDAQTFSVIVTGSQPTSMPFAAATRTASETAFTSLSRPLSESRILPFGQFKITDRALIPIFTIG